MERFFLVAAGINGVLAVGLGAFGAHGLQSRLAGLDDFERRMAWWQTASHYHLTHALALGLCAYLAQQKPGAAANLSGQALLVGIVIFCGSLYAMTLGAPRWFGAITPIGGLALMLGWAAVAVGAWQLR
ncbi:MAG: DUF423 domain-containing protein [Myxococcales bacterium]|nr:DUF423 domain-containing protein [Myxococcales bacterium]